MDSVCSIRVSRDHRLFVSFPRLFADFHARHRLLTPRHPPCALGSLTIGISNSLAGRNDPHRLNDTLMCHQRYLFAVLHPNRCPLPPAETRLRAPAKAKRRQSLRSTARILASSSSDRSALGLLQNRRATVPDAPEELRICSPLPRDGRNRCGGGSSTCGALKMPSTKQPNCQRSMPRRSRRGTLLVSSH